MRILFVSATEFEIEPFLKNNKTAEVLITGVGSPAAIYHLTKKLSAEKFDLVIQAGIAGTFSKLLKKTEVVLVKNDAFGDVGIEEHKNFKTIFQLGFEDENKFPFKKGWLKNPHKILSQTHLKVMNGITINKISDRKKQSTQLQNIYNADIETMEGAAVHYVCLSMYIPFLQIRSISNKVGERDKRKWKIKEAIENLNIELETLIQTLSGK